MGVQIPSQEWALLMGIMSGFAHMPLSTVPSGPDVRISPHAVDQHSD